MTTWKSFALRTTIAGAVMMAAGFAGVRFALGDPGGATSNNLTFSGVLRNTDGALPTASRTAMLTFAFTKTGGGTCTPAPVSATIAAGGGFSVLVPLSSCPAFFDGADVTYTVSEGATMLTTAPVAITPVPYARYADQVGVSDCPVGYARDTSSMTVTRCTRTLSLGTSLVDEVVRVGTGRSTFWVDRYEASVVDATTGASSTTYGGLNVTGQWASVSQRGSLLAVSRAGVLPSVNVTWFQAAALCRASGKRMMNREEWFAAADGMTAAEVGSNNCNVSTMAARNTGLGTSCVSSWGAQDMIGNVWEWTDEWYAGAGAAATSATPVSPVQVNRFVQNWPAEYNGDATWNVNGAVERGDGIQLGIPSAAQRGGTWDTGPQAGVFALSLSYGSSSRNAGLGFRCVVPD